MAPNCRLLAFYFRDNGEVVPDSMSVSVQGTSDNPVNVTFSVETAKPGDTVNLVISAKPNTTIFLLSVDKSVQLLKSGNDITQDTITEELVSYDYGSGFYGYWRYMFICGWPYPSRGSDASQVFNDANVIILTDGLVYEKPIERFPFERFNFAQPAPQAQRAMTSEPVARVRKNFPETWLFKTIIISSSGIYIQPEIAPDTITTWLTTAIAVHPLYGLSVTPKPAEITTFLPLFVTLNMPYSVIRGEDICMKAFAFNYYETALKMTLTMGKTDGIQVIRLQRNNRKPKGVEEVRQSISVSHYLGTVNPDTVATRTSASRRSSWGHCPSGSTSQHPQSLETV
ncbi:CD109 antigen-like isoform X3 [Pomacea canaliculata]|uniref:CD109 antigen-like isoform X3 n=1 Tax=Pomacea canaliculata TaxID=400727 RepID=UPI000D73ED44|nr:CD109 antigen-like isoform X3 [Pomacea canaliculata]